MSSATLPLTPPSPLILPKSILSGSLRLQRIQPSILKNGAEEGRQTHLMSMNRDPSPSSSLTPIYLLPVPSATDTSA